jgi:hypothetical protein
MPRDAVLIEHRGSWLAGTVLWEYQDSGRTRALVRYDLPSGVTVRRSHWADELRRSDRRVIELDLSDVVRERR